MVPHFVVCVHFAVCVLLGSAQTKIVHCLHSNFHHQKRLNVIFKKFKIKFSFRCNALARSISANCSKANRTIAQRWQTCNLYCLTDLETKSCLSRVASEDRITVSRNHLTLGGLSNSLLSTCNFCAIYLNSIIASLRI